MGKENLQCPQCGLTLYKQVSQCPRCFAEIPSSLPSIPTIETVYEHDQTPREKKDVKRTAKILFVIIVVVIVVLALSFYYIIPRMDIKVFTVYRESSGLSIVVDTKVENAGTLAVQHFSINLTITDTKSVVVARMDNYAPDVDSHSEKKFDNMQFFGDQYEPYSVSLDVRFQSEGKEYTKTYTHKVSEAMLITWEDSISQWGG